MHSRSSAGLSRVVTLHQGVGSLAVPKRKYLIRMDLIDAQCEALFYLNSARGSAAHSACIQILRTGGSRYCDKSTSGSLSKLNIIK
jgi:hypothetical protein